MFWWSGGAGSYKVSSVTTLEPLLNNKKDHVVRL